MRAGRLSAGHARALLAIDSSVEQTALARDAIRLGLSVRQLEARIRLRLEPPARKPASRDLHVADVEKQLMRSLGTRVRLQSRGPRGRGRIVIEFYSPAELQRLVERLRHV
jgi:ParB family chromosome partitioning protein